MSNDRTQDLLDRLRKLTESSTRDKKFVLPKDVDEQTWTRIPITSGFTAEAGTYDTPHTHNYIALIQWANTNCKGRYSRTLQAFWFEDPKDAFVFRLSWRESL